MAAAAGEARAEARAAAPGWVRAARAAAAAPAARTPRASRGRAPSRGAVPKFYATKEVSFRACYSTSLARRRLRLRQLTGARKSTEFTCARRNGAREVAREQFQGSPDLWLELVSAIAAKASHLLELAPKLTSSRSDTAPARQPAPRLPCRIELSCSPAFEARGRPLKSRQFSRPRHRLRPGPVEDRPQQRPPALCSPTLRLHIRRAIRHTATKAPPDPQTEGPGIRGCARPGTSIPRSRRHRKEADRLGARRTPGQPFSRGPSARRPTDTRTSRRPLRPGTTPLSCRCWCCRWRCSPDRCSQPGRAQPPRSRLHGTTGAAPSSRSAP